MSPVILNKILIVRIFDFLLEIPISRVPGSEKLVFANGVNVCVSLRITL